MAMTTENLRRKMESPMKITLDPKTVALLRELAERAEMSPEAYAAEALTVHVGGYDRWFRHTVEQGLKDVREGRVLSIKQSKQRDEARRAGLSNGRS
jgi:predicted transcriptional regulator